MCRVHTPQECLATRLGKSHVFEDSMSLDACPLLVDRSERSISAVCEPINIAGTTIGIIHSDIASDRVDAVLVTSSGLLIVVGVVRELYFTLEAELKLRGYDESLLVK